MLPRELSRPIWDQVAKALGAQHVQALIDADDLDIRLYREGWYVRWRHSGRGESQIRTGLASLEDAALAILQHEHTREAGYPIAWSRAKENVLYRCEADGLTVYVVRANGCGEVVWRSDKPHWSPVTGRGIWSWSTPPGFLGRASSLLPISPISVPCERQSLARLVAGKLGGA